MIRISQASVDALDAIAYDDFLARAERHLRPRCPKMEVFDPVSLDAAMRAAVDRAETYGVEYEADVLRFLDFEFRHGPRFDETCPWAKEILSRPHRAGDRKMDALDAHELFVLSLGLEPGAD